MSHQVLGDWDTKRETLESELARHIPEMNIQQKLKETNRHAVANTLPVDAVLIEFVRSYNYDFGSVHARGEPKLKPDHYIVFCLAWGSTRWC